MNLADGCFLIVGASVARSGRQARIAHKKARCEGLGAGFCTEWVRLAEPVQARVRLCAIKDSATLRARSMLPAIEPSV